MERKAKTDMVGGVETLKFNTLVIFRSSNCILHSWIQKVKTEEGSDYILYDIYETSISLLFF